MPIEFLGTAATNDGSEITARSGLIFDKEYTLRLLLAHRPNVSHPTFAAKTFATVDQVSNGRMTVHFITGGTDHEQQREGDYLTKDERCERTRECMQIVKKAWTSREPFDYQGKHYRLAFRPIIAPTAALTRRRPTCFRTRSTWASRVIPIVRDEVAKRDAAAGTD